MMNGLEQGMLYELSDTLGVDIYVLGVGQEMFLPKQMANPA